MKITSRAATLAMISAVAMPWATAMAEECATRAGGFAALEGAVEVAHADQSSWQQASLSTELCEGDSVRVGANSRAALHLINDAVLRLDQNTTMRLVDIGAGAEQRSLLDLVVGAFKSFSRAPRTMTVNTPYVNGMIEGTEFAMRVADAGTQVQVFEGKVRTANDAGEILLTHGQSATAKGGVAPQLDTQVRQNDAVQWTLYYPPLLASVGGAGAPAGSGNAVLDAALASAAAGDVQNALAGLAQIPAAARNADVELLNASLLLSVGQVDAARTAIDAVLANDAHAALALALRATIEVVQNQRAQALADAEAAVAAGDSAAARIALSYAQQANFQLDAARDTLLAAASAHPDDALVEARLAELWLMHGAYDQALAAATRAQALAPNLAKAQLVLGFVELAANRASAATTRFQQAVTMSSADPLAHFGLGLALIKRGQLTQGRAEIEAAVALDGSNALLRPYLGKAYYEEKRSPLDAQQYAIASELDPADPTPYFYEAIRAQTSNQPVAALHSLQQAIALNDNRAVYRSRELLDSDLASRGASVARIYSDLGFERRALVEGWNSVNTDPANFSAHRFLADAYGGLPRHEIARVSELLQSQLLQPLNTTPIQPRLAESNLFLVSAGGPAAIGFNEFNPVFTRDGLNYQGSSLVGEHDTYAGEGVVSGVFDKASFSLGGMHYTTDGYRDNADQRDSLANFFVQYALSPSTNVQAEYRYRNSERGDLAQRFFEDNFSPGERNRDEKNVYRFGVRHDFAPNSTLLGSFTYQEEDFGLRDAQPKEGPPLFLIDLKRPDQAFGGELQHLYRSNRVNLTSGFGYFDINSHIDARTGIDFPPPTILAQTLDTDARHINTYLYANVRALDKLVVTLGGSGDFLDSDSQELGIRNQFNPKAGISWEPWAGTVFRAAGFRTLKRTLVSDQTLEPTQVAGFNQFFDDINGTTAWRYGGAIDQRLGRDLYAGVEVTKGDLDVPYLDFSGASPLPGRVPWQEGQARGYLFWTPREWLALRSEYQYERAQRSTKLADGVVTMDTHRVPFSVNVFLPRGFSAMLRATYVHQHGRFEEISGALRTGATDFALLDMGLSYRLPRRYGIVSLGASNLLDRHFDYFDTDRNNPMFQPARAVFSRITVAFP
jgi:tetratricopeptide (TPR) repeat protein